MPLIEHNSSRTSVMKVSQLITVVCIVREQSVLNVPMVEDVFDSLDVTHVHKVELEHPEVEKTRGAAVHLKKPPHMAHWVLSTFTAERGVVSE